MDIILNIDNSILDFIQQHIVCEPLNKVMVFITELGTGARLWILIGLILLLIKKYRKYGIVIFVSVILSHFIGNVAIKHIVKRARPCQVNTAIDLIVNRPKSYSFPSGHTFTSFAPATVLFLMNKKIGIPALIIAALIGFSRMYLYVHYPSDVLCGAILGILVGVILTKLSKKYFLYKGWVNL